MLRHSIGSVIVHGSIQAVLSSSIGRRAILTWTITFCLAGAPLFMRGFILTS